MDLYLLSLIGSIFGAIGTTLIVLSKNSIRGIFVWVIGNGSMMFFTYFMGYYDQCAMWVYYEFVNFLGILKWYRAKQVHPT